MSREILDCLKCERDIYVKNVIHNQNTAFMFTPALTACVRFIGKFSENITNVCINREEVTQKPVKLC